MSARDNMTPEEKLLRLIRGKGKAEPKPAASVNGRSRAPDFKAEFDKKTYFRIGKFVTLINIEKLLIAGLALACLYLLISFVYPFVAPKKITPPGIQPQSQVSEKESIRQKIEPFDYYGQSISGKQIFGQAGPEGAASAAINSNLIKDMNLVGIMAGENPQAIIEDKRTQRTSYVVKGQFIGEFQVEDIQEGKIILNYRGQRYELYL